MKLLIDFFRIADLLTTLIKPRKLFVVSSSSSTLSFVVNETVTIGFPVDAVVDGASLPVLRSSRTLVFSFSVNDPPLSNSMKVKVLISSESQYGQYFKLTQLMNC